MIIGNLFSSRNRFKMEVAFHGDHTIINTNTTERIDFLYEIYRLFAIIKTLF